MNFFGHATVASWVSNAPAVVLGAMLPDFATMIRARPPTAKQPELWRGVRLHHDTDAVFHDHPVFRELCADAVAALSELGLARGPARATAHVGVEIHIDGVLARDDSARKSYLDALGAAPALAAKLDWRAAEESARFDELVQALAERGVRPEHSAPEVVALRVARALSGRPRLSLAAGDERRVAEWSRTASAVVADRLPPLLADLAHHVS
ncbi:MAG: hypothetical protein KC776_22480 [Myxococcales bacterium]|nr:hypothetical protein [Myxococcales bacterium]MCB9575753.1 hypothetical protein [Polyangiaceae bacterium]